MTTAQSVTMTMVDPKATETRLESLESTVQKLLLVRTTAEEKPTGDKAENSATDAVNTPAPKEKDAEVEGEITLIPELNCLSWPEWRKIRIAEEEYDNRQKDTTNKENKKPVVRPKQYVIDLVADTGDLAPPAYTDGQLSSKATRFYGRLRINSQHVLDVFSKITNLYLPQRCQILHPFKVIIDNLDKIQAHRKVLEDDLEKAKAAVRPVPQTNDSKPQGHVASDMAPHGTDNHIDVPDKVKKSKTKEETELEVAQEKLNHYRCFMDAIDTKLALEVDVDKAVREGKVEKIMFCHLWYLFPPGETIYFQKPNRDEPPLAAQILKVSGGRAKLPNSSRWLNYYDTSDQVNRFQKASPFTIDAFHLDFDGKKYRPFQVTYEIPKYPGECLITSLPVYPLRLLPESKREATMSLLLTRGRNFRNLAAVEAAHREYRGRTLDPEPEDIDGRVIIDFKQAAVVDNLRQKNSQNSNDNNNGERVFGLRPFTQTSNLELMETIGRYEDPDLTLYNDHNYDLERTDRLFEVNKVLLAPSQELTADELGDDELRLLPGTVYAYILRSRKYCRCDISFIQEITPNKSAFDRLVLPSKYKDLLKSLIDRHSLGSRPVEQKTDSDRPTVGRMESHSSHFGGGDDTLSIIKGKGRGLIILLHGVPGVGKTSTAETIAETTGRPLLPVTCGDIGENASEVEKNLEQIFTTSHRWGCVLLLDEAEVFLTKRNLQDLTRNAMVSIFLRALEFYSGILFLTTNRVGTIDEAFKSRIHISLYYPPHSWKTSKKIWKVNLQRCMEKIQADKDEILRFAKRQFYNADVDNRWNGRQIYNAFKTAIALAEYERSQQQQSDGGQKSNKPAVLTEAHFRQVVRVAKKFDDYLLETHGGMTMAATNQQQKVRADGFGLTDDGVGTGANGGPMRLKRRPTKARKLDLSEMSSSSEEEGEEASSDSESGLSEDEERDSSEEEEVVVKKKSKKKGGDSSSKKNDEKSSKKKSQSSKSKKTSRRQVEEESEDSSSS